MLLDVKNLKKSYKQGDGSRLYVLKGLNFSMDSDNIAIMGESGSGKTTFLNCISGLDDFDSGEIVLNNIRLNDATDREKAFLRLHTISFVFQFHYLISDFSVLENVLLPMQIAKKDNKKTKGIAIDILHDLGMDTKLDYFPAQLSGGERQRVAIARALITNPKLILMDEPTGNLDEELSIRIVQNILETSKHFKTKILLVTHDKNIAKLMDKIFIMENKVLREVAYE